MLDTCLMLMVLSVVLMTSTMEADVPAPKKKRMLVVTHTAGFRHEEAIQVGEKVLKEIGDKSGVFEVDYCRNAEDVQRMLTAEGLKPYDAVFFLNTTGDLGIPDLNAFLNWIKSGKAFIGVHAATDTYHNRPEFIEMIGGEFKTHGQQCEVEAIVEDAKHPAVAHLPSRWKIYDEIYEFTVNNRKKVHVLLSMDKHPNDGHPEAGQPGDYLLAWCDEYGKGRVFYTALGHRGDVWTNPQYQQHLLGGIRWALKMK